MADSEVAEVPAQSPPVLDVEEVRAKLLAIIDADPEKNGAAPDQEETRGCYYFLDKQNRAVMDVAPREEIAAPCCIVGHFFFDRPGALDNPELLTAMCQNNSIAWVLRSKERVYGYLGKFHPVTPPIPITPAAVKLLDFAQSLQDEEATRGGNWANIRDKIATRDVATLPGL